MTENEKAKAYDEALKKASAAHKDEDRHLKATLERIFPELKEDDDERIKKNCIHFLELQKQYHAATFEIEECIDWLEKQGEQKPTIEMKSAEESLGISSEEYNKIIDKLIYDEQKHTDKVEPKFKVGDWITNDYCVGKVIELTNDAYLLDTGQGIPFSCKHNVHLWTIQDAKDGDVLIDKSHIGECVFIFKEARASDIKTDVNNPLAIIGYCGINHIGFTSRLSGLGFGDTVNCIYYPATKEQRDTLMKAMNNAGYKWDADKKELKKLVPNKFDPNTLKPFDKVLIRDHSTEKWDIGHFSYIEYDLAGFDFSDCEEEGEFLVYTAGEVSYWYAVPYNEDTKHLVGTTDEAPEYYRYWEE